MRMLLYYASITFSLASNVWAQNDSVLLTLHFVAPTYQYAFTTAGYDHHGNQINGVYNEGAIPLRIDTSIIVPSKDSVSVNLNSFNQGELMISFFIDSSEMLIGNLDFETSEIKTDTDIYGPGSTQRIYKVTIDSVRFTLEGSSVVVLATIVEGEYAWNVFYGSNTPFYMETGGCNSSGTQIDTLSMELSPVNSLVSSPKASGAQGFSIMPDNKGFYEATFNPTPTERELDVMNLLGSKVISLPVCSESSSIRLPMEIPTGFYFARLGNEVAKFVVTQ